MLSRLRMNIDDCIEEYEMLGGEVFGHPRIASIRGPIPAFRDKYDGAQVKRVVERVVSRRLDIPPGEVAYFSSRQSICKTIVVANKQKTVEDGGLINEPPYLFRSYDHYPAVPKNPSERNPGRAHHGEIWQVARATSAAPTYFTPITINNRKFGDGGFGTNNPAWEVIWEVTQMTGKRSDLGNIALMVSIGTGMSPVSKFGQGLLGEYYAYFRAAKKLAVDSEKVHDIMTTVTGGTDGRPSYYRFNVKDGLGEMKLDEWKSPSRWLRRKENLTLKRIREKTNNYLELEDVQRDLKKLAKILVENRRKRCKTAIWDIVCLGMQYRCCVEGCPKIHKMRRSARDLRIHLRKAHRLDETNDEDRETIEEIINIGRCPC
ncbi:hypothetical protein FGG08_005739 [Glutinoglossum americanum]|uniref:PNPLA domain-containing protein n=1 Tax=Glutinoglossum americanum TaxID=1670608 RepID=A0A9P8L153_9PEZI|nr:hypothetical protein FGG08_005739 [Glutinoglossum americanum]